MAQSVFLKKDVKISSVVDILPTDYSESQFVDAFFENYPKDWDRIQKVYRDHQRRTKPGKKHPMPKPKQYLTNALKTWKAKK